MPSGAGLLQRPINEQIDELKSKIALLGKLKHNADLKLTGWTQLPYCIEE